MNAREHPMANLQQIRWAVLRLWMMSTLFVIVWVTSYSRLWPATDPLMRQLPIGQGATLFGAVTFYSFVVPTMLMLLALIVFVVGVVQTPFTTEKKRALLAGLRQTGCCNDPDSDGCGTPSYGASVSGSCCGTTARP